jgi:hypothetical protein
MLVPLESRFFLELGDLILRHKANVGVSSQFRWSWGIDDVIVFEVPRTSPCSHKIFRWAYPEITRRSIFEGTHTLNDERPTFLNTIIFFKRLSSLLRAYNATLRFREYFWSHGIVVRISQPEDSMMRSFYIREHMRPEDCFEIASKLARKRFSRFPRMAPIFKDHS